jgi:competence protein ComEA
MVGSLFTGDECMAMVRSFLLAILFCLALSPMAMADVNVNTANSIELESLPGIGPSKAAAIMQYRQDNGLFESLTDLDSVPGIGPATLQNISPLVTFSGDTTAVVASASETPSKKAVSAGSLVNVNTATQTELITLPGIGPSKAAAIIEYRHTNGAFSDCVQLARVRGIGDATIKNISPQCIVK